MPPRCHHGIYRLRGRRTYRRARPGSDRRSQGCGRGSISPRSSGGRAPAGHGALKSERSSVRGSDRGRRSQRRPALGTFRSRRTCPLLAGLRDYSSAVPCPASPRPARGQLLEGPVGLEQLLERNASVLPALLIGWVSMQFEHGHPRSLGPCWGKPTGPTSRGTGRGAHRRGAPPRGARVFAMAPAPGFVTGRRWRGGRRPRRTGQGTPSFHSRPSQIPAVGNFIGPRQLHVERRQWRGGHNGAARRARSARRVARSDLLLGRAAGRTSGGPRHQPPENTASSSIRSWHMVAHLIRQRCLEQPGDATPPSATGARNPLKAGPPRATRHTLVPLQLLERPCETASSREAARLLVATPPPVTDGLTCRAGAAGRRVALSRCFASGAGHKSSRAEGSTAMCPLSTIDHGLITDG